MASEACLDTTDAADADAADAAGDDFTDIVDGEEVAFGEADFVIEDDHECSAEDTAFDITVGVLQDVVIGDEFQALRHEFCEHHCHHFEDTDENKLVYTELHQHYSDLIEGFLERKLTEAIVGFSMMDFITELMKREGEVDFDVFELLVSLSDFGSFKQQMLAERARCEDVGTSAIGLCISGAHSKICTDEVEDGDERPDLEDLLLVSPSRSKPITFEEEGADGEA
eukprot:NODE_18042_length_913_cov_9.835878.p1 GENE.NODE_18042_length_913_cov_9.835878~~NODE_18042_length_913_cov_9.835878.p1  ORF type:complete len:226 (-),score=66.83 NODE_18042_length_913_cov_9.835878:227-904(-)